MKIDFSYFHNIQTKLDMQVVSTTIEYVIVAYEKIFGHIPTENLTVKFHNDDPVCLWDKTEILLCVEINRLDLIVYQFSHEFCHYLIKDRVADNLRWFEETICQTASYFFLNEVANEWLMNNSDNEWTYWHYRFKLCINANSINVFEFPLYSLTDPNSEYIIRLQQNEYIRELNRYVALQLLPFFKENPKLWLTVPYLSNLHNNQPFKDSLLEWISIVPDALSPILGELVGFLLSPAEQALMPFSPIE